MLEMEIWMRDYVFFLHRWNWMIIAMVRYPKEKKCYKNIELTNDIDMWKMLKMSLL